MKNQELSKILRNMAIYLEMKSVPFKPQAYEKAAYSIESLDNDIQAIYEKNGLKGLEEIPGVGKGIAERIEEYLKTGAIKNYEKFKKEIPVDLETFYGIEGLGPKRIAILYKILKIKNADDLERAALKGKIRELAGFGQKSEENIIKSIEIMRKRGKRFTLGFIMPVMRELESHLREMKDIEELVVAGSVRRRKETIGDIDVLAISKNPKVIMDYFVNMPEVDRVVAHGETKSAVTLKNGLDVDLRVVPKESFGSALNYFTGSKEHNVALRQVAIRKGYKLNEYGLFKGRKQIAGETEKDLYSALGLEYIEPEMRENTGEIEVARNGKLPHLIGYHDLKGDLQVQTNWTDGHNSIEEMIQEAIKIGHEYIAITDHTKSLAMTGGSDEKKLLRQMAEIDKINSKLKSQNLKLKVLKGAEVNIMKDGSLDIADEVLEKLDVVGAAVHSHFSLSREEQTKRIIKAMYNPHVDIIFHPTGRIINRREPYAIDIDEIIKEAKKTGTVLEIDAYPDRLDLKDEYIRKCVEAGVKMAIDTDAHAANHLHFLEYGIAQARRGWAKREDIINAWPLKKMLSFLKDHDD